MPEGTPGFEGIRKEDRKRNKQSINVIPPEGSDNGFAAFVQEHQNFLSFAVPRSFFAHIICKESKVWKLQKFWCYFRLLRVFEPIKHYRDGLAW